MLHLEPVDSQVWGSQVTTVLVSPITTGAFFPKSLGIGSVVSYHHHHVFTALPQFGISVLHG